jgi:hypothetical protein
MSETFWRWGEHALRLVPLFVAIAVALLVTRIQPA